jgi:hypothetical protein
MLVYRQEDISVQPKLLQVNYQFAGTRAEYDAANLPWAQPFAEMPGLLWKIWLMNEAESEAGGIVLFADDEARDAYVNGPLAEARKDPSISHMTVKRFDFLPEHTAITRGPVGEKVIS